jgi:hypothetical protein
MVVVAAAAVARWLRLGIQGRDFRSIGGDGVLARARSPPRLCLRVKFRGGAVGGGGGVVVVWGVEVRHGSGPGLGVESEHLPGSH